jgi:hypothetical protein
MKKTMIKMTLINTSIKIRVKVMVMIKGMKDGENVTDVDNDNPYCRDNYKYNDNKNEF